MQFLRESIEKRVGRSNSMGVNFCFTRVTMCIYIQTYTYKGWVVYFRLQKIIKADPQLTPKIKRYAVIVVMKAKHSDSELCSINVS